MRTRFLLTAGLAVAAAALSWTTARAQLLPFSAPSGPISFYIGVEGGYSGIDDTTGQIVGTGIGVRERFNDGYNVGGRAGIEWGSWRFEEEFRFQNNDSSSVTFNGLPAGLCGGVGTGGCTARVGASGDRRAYAIMTNAIYDFHAFPGFFGISPHIGVGIGAVGLEERLRPRGAGTLVSDTQWEFGYQGIVGLRYNINPSLILDVDYRYLGTTDPTFRTVGGFRYRSDYESHNLVASLSYRFGPPAAAVVAPPAPPAPPPVTRRVFLVFFDWDRDTITPDGMRIVQQAAEASRTAQVQIQVTGYTDASGSAGYNQRLSERRANNVANALVQFGVPRQQMVISGRGKNDQRVPTADGVREPQNRRVEIVFP